jgi:hypothetical protein
LNLACALVLAAPLALLAADGMLEIVGLMYLGFYIVIMIIPTAIYVLMLFDALRVLLHRDPVFMPFLLAMRKAGTAQQPTRPRFSLLTFAILGNVFASLSREMWFLAFRFNPQAMERMSQAAKALGERMGNHQGLTYRLVAVEMREVPSHRAEVDLVVCA